MQEGSKVSQTRHTVKKVRRWPQGTPVGDKFLLAETDSHEQQCLKEKSGNHSLIGSRAAPTYRSGLAHMLPSQLSTMRGRGSPSCSSTSSLVCTHAHFWDVTTEYTCHFYLAHWWISHSQPASCITWPVWGISMRAWYLWDVLHDGATFLFLLHPKAHVHMQTDRQTHTRTSLAMWIFFLPLPWYILLSHLQKKKKTQNFKWNSPCLPSPDLVVDLVNEKL